MGRWFQVGFFGKKNIASRFSDCVQCRRLSFFNSYDTVKFLVGGKLPLLPLGRFRILEECPHCGHRAVATHRKYEHERKRSLDGMMAEFSEDRDNMGVCCHALQTLMVYDEEAWFRDLRKIYGARFAANKEVQLLLAQGLCRFGDYDAAMVHCRQAIVLGVGRRAEVLLELCQKMKEATEWPNRNMDSKLEPESAKRAYLPLLAFIAILLGVASYVTVQAMRTHTVWLVSGSLEKYAAELDGKRYTLGPGEIHKTKLRLGHHELSSGKEPLTEFDYSIPLFKQFAERHLLIVNPDAMAIIAVKRPQQKADGKPGVEEVHFGERIHLLQGIGSRRVSGSEGRAPVRLVRPKTHMEALAKMQGMGLTAQVGVYARRALAANPASPEADALLGAALADLNDAQVAVFLRKGLAATPPLMPWHARYQDHMQARHPEYDLVAEYAARCQSNPDEPENFYLLGRIVENPEVARRSFLLAEKGRGCGGRGYQAIARNFFVRGQFSDALPYSDNAVDVAPESPEFFRLNRHIHLALRNYGVLAGMAAARLAANPGDLAAAEDRVLHLACEGYHIEAEQAAAEFSAGRTNILARLNAVRFYAVGNLPSYFDYKQEAGDSMVAFERLLYGGKVAEADRWLSGSATNHPIDHLLLHCLAMENGNAEIAETHLALAQERMADPGFHGWKAAGLLSPEQPPAVPDLAALEADPVEIALLSLVLGYRFPAMQAEYDALARLYNFTPQHPQILIRKWAAPVSRPVSP